MIHRIKARKMNNKPTSKQALEQAELTDFDLAQHQREIKEFEKSPWAFWVRKSKLTILLVVAILIFGLLVIKEMPRELNPEVKIPIASVITIYPGASPTDVEDQVTKELESEISNLTSIKKLSSTSSLGLSVITVEFEADEDIDSSIRDLKDKVDKAKPSFPEEVKEPEVVELNYNDCPIMTITVSGERYDAITLKQFAENIKDQLKGISSVSKVVVTGGREETIDVVVNQEKLVQYGLSLGRVAGALKANNIDFPLGSIEIRNSSYNVRIQGKFNSLKEIASLPVGQTLDGKPVFLEDVAAIKKGLTEEVTRSYFSPNRQAPMEAVSLQVYKKSGGDITKMAREVRATLQREKGGAYPNDVVVEVTNDFSVFVSDNLNNLISNGLATIVLIFILLLLFLGWKEALLAGPAIPFSFFIAFIVMALVGESMNKISLFSLVLSLGLLVDSTIVIVEGMYNKVSRFGLNSYQAALSTIKEYAAPLLSGMMTTVAAFFPLLFVKGIFGAFIKTVPTVVIAALMAGLFVAVSIIPALGLYLIKPIKKTVDKSEYKEEETSISQKDHWLKTLRKKYLKAKPRQERLMSKGFNVLIEKYYQTLPRIIGSKKKRRRLIVGAWIAFVVAISLPFTGMLKVQSFGAEDRDTFYINLEMPNGTTLDRTNEVVVKIENELRTETTVKNFVSNIGASMGAYGIGEIGNTSNKAYIQVNLVDREEREIESPKIVSQLRKKLKSVVTEGRVSFLELTAGPAAGKPIELRVSGADLAVLEKLAKEIAEKLKNIPTVVDVEISAKPSAGEIVFIPNKQALAKKGLTVIQLASELHGGISGNDDVEITHMGEDEKIVVKYPQEKMLTVEKLEDILFLTPRGEQVALSELGEIKFLPAPATIYHRDEERVVIITADTDGGNATEIVNQLKQEVKKMTLPAGYRVSYGGETQELQEIYIDMLFKMILGIILILFILVLQFNSYKQTLIILFTIPLAMIGVFFGMAIARMRLDIPAFIGIVSLAGIVVNNAIILIDQMNRELARGKDLMEAVRISGAIRMRPIFLTTITTILGLLPLSLSEPVWNTLGFSIIFGLTFSTFLTLVIVPALFVSLYEKKFSESSWSSNT